MEGAYVVAFAVFLAVVAVLKRREREKDLKPTGIVCLSDDGFTLERPKAEPVVVRWSEVREIVTFKRDLFAYDNICLAFRCGGDWWVEIWEEDEGFRAVASRLRQLFPSVPEDWWPTVVVPAFEGNERVLFRRD